MRTTVTLDQDVAAKLQAMARERGVSFKAALNETVRAGLDGEGRSARPYRTPSRRMGLRRGIDLNHTGRLLAELDNAEIARKLQLGK
ncbi:MAG TPA: ribbon-helix-helix protein, CopG family [Solirubrobacteraceae bacterium]|jgi:predicted transcriptional regulator